MDQGFRVFRFWNNQVLEEIEGAKEAIVAELGPHPNPLPVGEG